MSVTGGSDSEDSLDSSDSDSDASEDKVPSTTTTPSKSGAVTQARTPRHKTEEADMVRNSLHE